MSKNVSDQLVEMLVQAGIKRVYAITGDSLNPVNDAIRRDGRLEWIHVRHEESAAYAASMDAELNGIGCCMGSSGPGHVHLINGLYDANRAGNPVIAIASTCATQKFGTHWFQETNPFLLFQDCSKYVYVANTPKQFTTMMQRAIQTAINEKGVAVLGLPGDVAGADLEEVPTATQTFLAKPVVRPSDSELDKLAAVLNDTKHKKITLYCGHGCQYAVSEVEQLAETLKAPIVTSFRGKIFFDRTDSPYIAGMNGLLGHRSGYDACAESDVLVMLGTDFPYAEFLPKKNTIIQIDQRPDIIGRRAKVDYGFAGDVKDTIAALLPKLTPRSDDSFLKDIHKEYVSLEKSLEDYTKRKTEEDQIDPEYAAKLLDKYAAEDAIFTVDTGMNVVWAARFVKGTGKRYLTGSFNHGSMANALPMAIGAAAASPGRQVVAMCGDGGLSMLLGDLATLMQYQYPVKIFVFNNRSLAMVKLEMEVSGYLDWQTNMVNPPFDKIADLMNIKGYEVHKTEELEATVKAAFEHEGPTLVNIYTNRDTLAMPPHITFDQMKGFATNVMKKIGQGDFSEAKESIANSIKHIKDIL